MPLFSQKAVVTGGNIYSAEANAYFLRTTGMTYASKVAINNLILGLQEDLIWSLIDDLHVAGTADNSTNGLANMYENIKSTLYTATTPGGGNPTFSNDGTGVSTSGTSQDVATGFKAQSGSLYVTDDWHMAWYGQDTATANDDAMMGWKNVRGGASTRDMLISQTGTTEDFLKFRIDSASNDNLDLSLETPATDIDGYSGISRTGSSTSRVSHVDSNGVYGKAGIRSSTTISNPFLEYCAIGGAINANTGVFEQNSNCKTGAWSLGGGLTNTKLDNLGVRLQAYFAELGTEY